MIVKSDLMLNDRECVSSRAVSKQYPNKSLSLHFKISFYKTGKKSSFKWTRHQRGNWRYSCELLFLL